MTCRYGEPQVWTRASATCCCNIQPASHHTASQSPPDQVQPALAAITAGASLVSGINTDDINEELAEVDTEAAADHEAVLERTLQQSLVLVTVETPHVGLLDGTHAKSFTGL